MASSARTRRHDPERRDRIIDACLDVIAEHGVAGTSARRVATSADVPLGSMTYHFEGMDELLREAFRRFVGEVASTFERRLSAASSPAEAREAVVALITEDVFGTQRELALTHELYTLAARDERYRELTSEWMSRSRAELEHHFDPLTARMLDAMLEGLTIHRALDVVAHDREVAREAVERIVGSVDRLPLSID